MHRKRYVCPVTDVVDQDEGFGEQPGVALLSGFSRVWGGRHTAHVNPRGQPGAGEGDSLLGTWGLEGGRGGRPCGWRYETSFHAQRTRRGGGLGWGCRRLGAQGGVTAGRASSRRSDLALVSGSGVSGRKGHPFVPSTEGHEAPTGPAEVSSAPVGPGADRRHLALIIPVSQGLPSRVQAGVRGGREASMRPAGGGGRPRAAGCN